MRNKIRRILFNFLYAIMTRKKITLFKFQGNKISLDPELFHSNYLKLKLCVTRPSVVWQSRLWINGTKLSLLKGSLVFFVQTLKAVGVYDYAPLITKMEFCSKAPSKW